jgi:hypothetical protein
MSLRNRLGVEIHQASDPASLAAAASLGGQYWRADYNWNDIQSQRDVWAWDYFDAMVAGAQTHGCSIAALIGYTPDWANGGRGRTVPPIEIQHWEYFVATVAERYRGQIGIWLLWNEPNRGYWTGTVDEYVDYIVIPAVRVLKSVDPNNLVCGPELSTEGNWDTWLRTFLQRAGDLVDIITVHAYDADGQAVWRKLTQARRWYEFWKKPSVREVIERAGYGQKSCWVTEVGWQSNQVGEEGQAQRWDQLLERLQGSAWPAGIVVFNLMSEAAPDREPVTWGIFRADGTAKPAAEVLRRYTDGGAV